MSDQLFPLGRVVATPGALDLLENLSLEPSELIRRHHAGDWSEMQPLDQEANTNAVKDGGRIFSSYRVGGQKSKVWVITEADRSVTTILLPMEY